MIITDASCQLVRVRSARQRPISVRRCNCRRTNQIGQSEASSRVAMSDIGVGIIDTVWNCWRRTNHNDQSGESSRVEKCVRYVNITAPDHSDPQPANGRTANRERRGGGGGSGVWTILLCTLGHDTAGRCRTGKTGAEQDCGEKLKRDTRPPRRWI